MKKLIACLFLYPSLTLAAPNVTNFTGTFENGASVTITGTGFGTKSPAAPIIWAPFNTSATPSTLGQSTSLSAQNVAWNASAGYDGGGMIGTAGSGNWTMGVTQTAWNEANSITYIFSREKRNYNVENTSQNSKTRRFWPASGAVSNVYISDSHGRIYVENIGTESGYWSNAKVNSTDWVVKEFLMKASSANGVKDGTITERFNGVQKHSGTIISKSASAPSNWTTGYVFHQVVANKGSWNPAWSSSNNVWVDDLYVDRTYSRIMIGDASTFANCRKFGLVIPAAWSGTTITGTLQYASLDFPADSTAYVYVFDSSNVPNPTGYSFVMGGDAADPAPSITSVSISTGAYGGGTVSTMTGTAFVSGATVLVGTSPATGVTFLGATSIQFTIPAGPPGETGLDLRVTNPDTQFSVLTATMSYTAPSNQAPYNVSAGDDWVVVLPASALISGFAEDDGLPESPGALSYLWEKVSGPGTVTFGNSTALQTTASFSEAGTYTIKMTADDGELSTESEVVTVIVSATTGIAFPWKQ